MDPVPDLLRLLADPDIDVRWRAAITLSRQGPEAVEPLMRKLFEDDRNVRILAIWALGRLGDSRAVPSISRALEDESEPVRLAAEGALSRIKEHRPAPFPRAGEG